MIQNHERLTPSCQFRAKPSGFIVPNTEVGVDKQHVFEALPKEQLGSYKPAIVAFLKEHHSHAFTPREINDGLGEAVFLEAGQYPLATELDGLVKAGTILKRDGSPPHYMIR